MSDDKDFFEEEEFEELSELDTDFNDYGDDINELIFMEKDNFSQYDIKITSARLNCFSGPGLNYSNAGIVKRDQKFTVLEEHYSQDEDRLWGKIKIGDEFKWINLKYSKEVYNGSNL